MLKCPHCDKPGIPVLQKLFLGPKAPATCKVCGQKAGVSYTSWVGVIPVVIAFIVANAVEAREIKILAYVIGFLAAALLHIFKTPLEPR